MKQISALELGFLVKELKDLEDSRVDKIYNSGKGEIYLQLHKSNVGKKLLRIIVGKGLFLSEEKDVDENPSGFRSLLKKYLEGKFLDSVEQLEPERILKFIFKTKEEKYYVYLEFFGKGNFILCGRENIIIDCLIHHKFKDRTIFPKEKYQYPHMEYDLFDLNKKQLENLLKSSKKDTIITALATELGLGGVYSEEICLLSKIDKNKIPLKIDDNEIIKIISTIKKLIKTKPISQFIYKDKKAIDAVPFVLEFYKGFENKECKSYNEALSNYFTSALKASNKKDTVYIKKINEIRRIMEEQEFTLSNLKLKETSLRKKGEAIYNNYQTVKEILDEVNKASKKHSWEEIKKRLKGHKTVKDVDVKEKRVTVEI